MMVFSFTPVTRSATTNENSIGHLNPMTFTKRPKRRLNRREFSSLHCVTNLNQLEQDLNRSPLRRDFDHLEISAERSNGSLAMLLTPKENTNPLFINSFSTSIEEQKKISTSTSSSSSSSSSSKRPFHTSRSIDREKRRVESTIGSRKSLSIDRNMPNSSRYAMLQGGRGKNVVMSGQMSGIDSRSMQSRQDAMMNESETSQNSQNRRPSAQSLKLDLDGLDLGPHGGESSTSNNQKLTKSSTNSPISTSIQKESSVPPFLLSGANDGVLGAELHHQYPHYENKGNFNIISSRLHEEDTFAMHLRDCEDAHDIPSVETVLQNPSKMQLSDRERMNEGESSIAHHPENNEYVLGGFASLGITKSMRPPFHPSVGSDTDMTASSSSMGLNSSPTSPSGINERLSPWSTLKLQQCDPIKIVDILSIDEMGLHSINVGSSDDWRGTSLEASMPLESDRIGVEANTNPINNVAEWSIARNQKRQRKWIVTPTSNVPERTVVVSDHITKSKHADMLSVLHQSAFSGQSSFSLRFLQAGSKAPDCSIILATPSAHRLRIEEQNLSSPISTSNLSSKGIHEEQMQNLDAMSSISATTDEDGWPALRTRAITSITPPTMPSSPRIRERRLTHSKSTSTIIASIPIEIESRRPSLGKSMSHEGLSPDVSPRPNDHAFNEVGQSSHDTYVSPFPRSIDAAAEMFGTNTNKSPFANYSLDQQQITLTQNPIHQNVELQTSTAPHETGPSPRSSMSLMAEAIKKDENSKQTRDQRIRAGSPLGYADAGVGMGMGNANRPFNNVNKKGASQSNTSTGQSSSNTVRREKRLSIWLRKKVLSGGGGGGGGSGGSQASSSTHSANSSVGSPPLPPAWETLSNNVFNKEGTSSVPLQQQQQQQQQMMFNRPQHSKEILSQQEGVKTDDIKVDFIQSPENATFDGNAKAPTYIASIPIREQRRRSNSDDVLNSINELHRRRMQAVVMGNNLVSEAITRKVRSSSGTANSNSNKFGVEQDLISVSLPSTTILGNKDLGSIPQDAFLRQGFKFDHTQQSFIPDLYGLEDVPAGAMTMIIALPLSNNPDIAYASRYLRVSFIPFQVSASSSHGSDEVTFGSTAGGVITQSGGEESIGCDQTGTGFHSGGPNWYRRLAHAWHTTPNSQSAYSDDEGSTHNRSPPNGINTEQPSSKSNQPFTNNEKCEPFRIIAKILANTKASSLDLTTVSAIPQPFSFPVILGMCDSMGRLDLIPEGWQSIGLAAGPAPDDLNVENIDSTRKINVPHPLRGIADLIIAGCAACMDL